MFKTPKIFFLAGVAALLSCLTPPFLSLTNSYVGLFLAILIIAFYHAFLFLRVTDLSNDEIDTIYYLGFLVTLLAMAATIIQLAYNIEIINNKLIFELCINFGAGLFATGYALLARMHLLLSPKRQSDENLKLEDLEKEISERIYNIISKISIASGEFAALTQSLQESLVSSNERGILQITRTFDSFSSIAENASIEISERIDGLQRSIRNFDIEDKQRKIHESLVGLDVSIKTSSSSLDDFSNRVDIGKEKFQNLNNGVVNTNNALEVTREKMTTVGQTSETLQNNLNDLSLKAENIGSQLKQDLLSLVPTISEANLNIKKSIEALAISLDQYSSQSSIAGAGMSTLNTNISALGNALSNIASDTKTSNTQVNSEVLILVSNISSANLALKNSINDLSTTLKGFKELTGNSDSNFQSLNKQLENLTRNISNISVLSESFKKIN